MTIRPLSNGVIRSIIIIRRFLARLVLVERDCKIGYFGSLSVSWTWL